MARGKENAKAVSDEEIIAALMANGTIAKAAAAAGITSRALYDRMGENAFQAQYKAAKAALLRETVFNINAKITTAIKTIADIMQDTETSPAIRLQAAQTILNNAAKFSERLNAQDSTAEEARSSPFDFFF